MRVRVAFFLLLAPVAAAADAYIGSWTNKRASFDTVAFALRSDGKGIYGAAASVTFLRWQPTEHGVRLKIAAGEGRVREIQLIYDPATKTFMSAAPIEGRTEKFWQRSTAEPADREADAIAAARKRKERFRIKKTEQEFSLMNEALQALASWSAEPLVDPGWQTAFLHATPKTWVVTARKIKGKYFLKIPLLSMSVENPTDVADFPSESTGAKPALPVRFSFGERELEAFRGWLDERKVKYSVTSRQSYGLWELERYWTEMEVSFETDGDAFIAAVRNFLEVAASPAKPPYVFTVVEPPSR